jgi:hypothetical protein
MTVDLELTPMSKRSHRVHAHASPAIIRARKPSSAGVR